MAVSNRDRIGKMFDVLSPALDAFISRVLEPELADQDEKVRTDWSLLLALKDAKKGASGKTYSRTDPYVQLRMLSENITGQVRQGWFPFDGKVTPAQRGLASELRDTRHDWAHGNAFSDDDAYRALDTAERLLSGLKAHDAADEIKAIRRDLRRVTAARDDARTLRHSASPESAGLRPWREVLPPHDDVARGNFQASEFAADLYKVATQSADTSTEYADPVEFFRRTYLTEGLTTLIAGAVRRISGDQNAESVINLQTNFGGGKTHSMLSLWHIAAGHPAKEFPQELQELLQSSGYGDVPPEVKRVAIVGNHFSPSGELKPDGTRVNTIWGELAWQLGGADGYAMVAEADQLRTPPGERLHALLAQYAPALILIDEWVSYARELLDRDDLPAGTFEAQFAFAQALTEAVRGTPGCLLAISIPASHSADGNDSATIANTEEVAGTRGWEALKRLQNVVRRVAQQWRPASSEESYEIVRRRLFKEPNAEALASISATAREFAALYHKHVDEFPRETREREYEDRLRRTYPIHPELFDRLYEDWSSLERFQRTRGVLRLMSTVIHALWQSGDQAPVIMPGSIPVGTAAVNSELVQYLPDNWKAVIDADVDGPNSEPARIDSEKPLLGQRSVTQRLARTVFFGSAPALGSAHQGLETTRVFLGTATPGDTPGNFHSALSALGDRATYFYSGQGRYWYALQANVSRRARDAAEALHVEDVWVEIVRRLKDQASARGEFARVHVCPDENGDIPDEEAARLVILHPRVSHAKGTSSSAIEFADRALTQRGSSTRTFRNMLVFLAADAKRLEELDYAVRDYLGWTSVSRQEATRDLTQDQINSAKERARSADDTVEGRLLQTFSWGLVPEQLEADKPPLIREVRIDSSATTSLAERVGKKLGNEGALSVQQAARAIRIQLDRFPQLWQNGHIKVGDLWRLYAEYVYMPRLVDRGVLSRGVTEMPMLWAEEAFALATGFDETSGRYVGLWIPDDHGSEPEPQVTDSLLLVRPDVAAKQHAADKAVSSTTTPKSGGEGSSAGAGADPSPGGGTTPPPPSPPVLRTTRFFGSKQLDPARYAVDFQKIADEVIAHLAAAEGVTVNVTIEIEATTTEGFDDARIRTVKENATTLKFTEPFGFEQS